MRKRIASAFIVAAISFGIMAQAKAESEIDFIPMTATGYCLTSPRCDGGKTRVGICAVKDKSHYGDVAMVYERNKDGTRGKFIGYYEVLDYCPKKTVIDIWYPTASECITRKVYVCYRKGVG